MSGNVKGLGRGLGSLLGRFDDEDDILASSSEKKEIIAGVQEIDIGKIDRNEQQPRKSFDANALNELSASIKIHGVIQPIIVEKNGDRYTIIAGERRFRASKLAGLKKIPAIVKEYDEKQKKEIALLENIQREDLNAVETAKGMKELLDTYGYTQDELASRLGKSRPVVANYLRLLTLCPEVLEMIESGKLSAGHARCLVVVSDPAVQVKLAKLAMQKKVTVRDMEKIVKDMQNPKSKDKLKKQQSAELQDLINTMQRKFATKVSVLGNDKKGRIFIDYYSTDDLDRIYTLLNNIK